MPLREYSILLEQRPARDQARKFTFDRYTKSGSALGANTEAVSGRAVAILVASGIDATHVAVVRDAFRHAGARVDLVATTLAAVQAHSGEILKPDRLVESTPPLFYDIVVVPGGDVSSLKSQPALLAFVTQAFKCARTIGLIAEGLEFFATCPVPPPAFELDAGLQIEFGVLHDAATTPAFLVALLGEAGKQCHFSRTSIYRAPA